MSRAARSRVEGGVAAVVLAAIAVYAVGDDTLVDDLVYLGVMLGASIVAWAGAERAPAEHRLVGRLIAAGVSLTFLGDTVWEVLDARGPTPQISVADPLWCLSYVALSTALCVVLRRSSAAGRDGVAFLVDAATILVVSILVFWSTAVGAILADEGLEPHVRLVYAVYPIADAILLALVVRVLTSRRARAALDPWFALGVCLWLAADMMYLQSPSGAVEIVMDSLWMIAPVLIARTAWRLGTSTPPDPAAVDSRARLGQLGVAIVPLLVPPLLELVTDLRGEPHQPVLLVVGSTLLIVLAFVRMALLIRSEEQAHRELEVARDAALEASRAKSMFVATMSHEIRTPLTMVLGGAEMLEDSPLDDLQLQLVRRMRRSGTLLRTLVDGILDFSRIEAGQLELEAVEFDLRDLLDDLDEIYRTRAAQGGIGLECRTDDAVPRTVVGDPARLVQVLSNLLDNALKFTHEGHVRLEAVPAPAPGDEQRTGDGVAFVVSDTGIGIRQEDLASVFESFNQLDGSTTRRYGGSGLGLAICKQLVELMGGSVTVDSEPGRGSVFRVWVPLSTGSGDGARPGGEVAPGVVRASSRVTSPASG